jgi:hypothetical protein
MTREIGTPGLRRLRRTAAITYRAVRSYGEASALMRDRGNSADASPRVYTALLRRLAAGSDSVLDVGTGLMGSLAFFPCRVKLGMDGYRPYLENRLREDAVPINADARRLGELFLPRSIDLVTLIDVIEHFDDDAAREVLRHAELIARRRVVVAAPRGVFPQEGHDAFGLGGEEYQRHRSSWDVEDFTSLGYRVAVLKGFHDSRNESFVRALGRGARPVDALVAWRDVAASNRPA